MAGWVKVGGRIGAGKSIAIEMMDGYDRPDFLDVALRRAATLPEGRHLVRGSLDNPLFQWPMFAVVEKMP